jgi:hypothetical protein
MNPEYVYKQKLYKVTLMGDKAGTDIEGLAGLFLKSKYHPLALLDTWRDSIGKAVSIAEWQELRQDSYFLLITELEALGAVSEHSEFEKIVVFDDQSFAKDLRKRYVLLVKRYEEEQVDLNRWEADTAHEYNQRYSDALLKLEDYALVLWARAENIEEAYRLIKLPSFANSELLRIYRKDSLAYFVYKQGQKPYTSKTGLMKHSHSLLPTTLWQNLMEFMKENFWTADTWYGRYVDFVHDGERLLFEGWKDGQYKFLDDHSPEQDKIAFQAQKLFEQILKESKKG